MNREKRMGNVPIPDNLKELLTDEQLNALSGMTYSGWEILFLRRPLFQEPVLVVHKPSDGRIGVLDKDGRFIVQADIDVRVRENLIQTPLPKNLHYY